MPKAKAFLPDFVAKMAAGGLPRAVIDTFSYYYQRVVDGETGLLSDADIAPIGATELPDAQSLGRHAAAGRRAYPKTAMIKLNGGLGTSMGLTTAKSLLDVKDGKSFLAILLRQAERTGVRLALMNSFSTDADTRAALEDLDADPLPAIFLQNKFPKILRDTLAPAVWPADPEKEWNPPGHGDIYTAMQTSGMLRRLRDAGIDYAFISNSDNLGASVDPAILGFLVENGLPFLMEVAERTPSDTKGGHLARLTDGRLVLREVAQCPKDEIAAFTDISLYRYFNTNNIWVHLGFLEDLLSEQAVVRLPMILNPKTLDPRDKTSPPVYQVETAMGSAISLFPGAGAVRVPKDRLIPVKTCNDLLSVRSDVLVAAEDERLQLNPDRKADRVTIRLDPAYFGTVDRFEARFPEGAPSLVDCESLTVTGDVRFQSGVVLRGHVTITNPGATQAVIPKDAIIEGDVTLSSG